MKKILIAFLALLAILSIRFYDPWIVEVIRLKSIDSHQRSVAQEVIPLDSDLPIVVVNIDNSAIEKNGQWPWSRDVLANEVIKLFEHNAGLVVMPMLFSERDRFGGDKAFVELLKHAPVIVGQVPALEGKGTPVPRGVAIIGEGWEDWIYRYDQAIGPTKQIGKHALGVGMMLTSPEADGVVRKLPLVVRIPSLEDGESARIFPSLSMEIIRVLAGDPSYQMKIGEAGVEALRVPAFDTVKTDANGSIYVDYHFKAQEFSLNELPDLQGAVVILSLTASGLDNTIATPIGRVYDHDLIAASVYTMLEGINISRPWWSDLSELAVSAAVSAVVIAAVLFLNWYYGIGLLLVSLGVLFYGTRYAFNYHGLLLDWSFPLFAVFVTWSIAAFLRFMEELRQKLQIKKQFGTYLSPDLVAKLQKNPELLKLGGEKQDLSIMFTDVRGFTTISEHYGEDVQGLTSIMNRYMTAMTQTILQKQGTLDKYIGDAQMAFWNAPILDEEHAVHAVESAIQMLTDLDNFNAKISQEGIPPFGMGIGINTGNVVVGNMGSSQRFDYTCLGDAVNLASRLEGQSKSYGVRLVLGPETAKLVENKYPVTELDCIAVKGKTIGVKIYTVGTPHELHADYLDLYYKGDWKKAKVVCEKIIKDGTSAEEYYLLMIKRLETGVPENWDGTYRATSK